MSQSCCNSDVLGRESLWSFRPEREVTRHMEKHIELGNQQCKSYYVINYPICDKQARIQIMSCEAGWMFSLVMIARRWVSETKTLRSSSSSMSFNSQDDYLGTSTLGGIEVPELSFGRCTT